MSDTNDERRQFAARLLSAALSPFRDIADELEKLPDGQKIKPWTEILLAFISTPIAVIGACVTVSGATVAATDLYLKYSSKLADEQRIRNSPVHVSLEAKATRIIASDTTLGSSTYAAVLIEFIARNLSQRDFYLLKNKWVVFGIKLSQVSRPDPREVDAINNDFNPTADKGSDVIHETSAPLAFGQIFPNDNILRPSEVISRRVVVYAPVAEYNHIRVDAALPIVSRSSQDELIQKKRKAIQLEYLDKGVLEWKLQECPDFSSGTSKADSHSQSDTECDDLPVVSHNQPSRDIVERYEFLQKIVSNEVLLREK